MLNEMRLFLGYLQGEKNFSPNTVSAYRSDIFLFYETLQDKNIDVKDIAVCFQKENIFIFIERMRKGKYASASIARALATLKSFHKFLIYDNLIPRPDEDIFHMYLPVMKQEQKIPPVLSVDEVRNLLESINTESFIGMRDRTMFEIIYASGIRVSELCGLNWDDYRGDCLLIKGKGQKQRLVPIHSIATHYVDEYRYLVKKLKIKNEEKAIFVSFNGNRITRKDVWQALKYYKNQIGMTKDISPHSLRHSVATHLLENGMDISIIKEILGHSNIQTTDRYTHLSTKKLEESFEKFHPRP